MLDKMLMTVLGPLLDKMGTGWKTATGLLVVLLAIVLKLLGKITQEQADWAILTGGTVFGVGIYHKTADRPNPPQ